MSIEGQPLVSVIIPAFNSRQYIRDAIESVQCQTYANWEIIVVDDCSSDATTEFIASTFPSCRVLSTVANGGPSVARNLGIQHARGEYIAFLDADDCWSRDKLAIQIAAFKSRPELIAVSCRMERMELRNNCADCSCVDVEVFGMNDLLIRNRLATPTVVVAVHALRISGLFDVNLRLCEDYDLWLRLAEVGPVGRIPLVLAWYRERSDGLSAGNREKTYENTRAFIASLTKRFATYPGISGIVRRSLSIHALEHSIELSDRRQAYRKSFLAVLESFRYYPFGDPRGPGILFARMRRIRRIVVDASRAFAKQLIDATRRLLSAAVVAM